MRPIQMVDLQQQYRKIKPEMDAAIQAVIDSAAFVKGAQVEQFARNLENYTGSHHVIPVANGTEALQIALMALGLKPGDEVLVSVAEHHANFVPWQQICAIRRTHRQRICGLLHPRPLGLRPHQGL